VDGDMNTSEPLPLDQRGEIRVVDQVGVSNAADGLDIGAFESEPPTATVEVSPNGPDGAPDPNDLAGGAQPTSWSRQRSDIREIIVRLGSPASSATANDVVLTNLGVDAPADADLVVSLADTQLSLSPDGLVITISFASGQLDDGVYQLDLLSGITGGATFTITGNSINKLYVMTGDWNGSGGINIQDFATFAYWFSTTVPTAPHYVDVNDSGGVNIQDFSGFAANFGKNITFPGAVAPLSAGDDGEGELVSALRTLANPSDVNGDGALTARDALNVINELENGGSGRQVAWSRHDANEDGIVTSRDALFVINRLAEQTDASSAIPAAEQSTHETEDGPKAESSELLNTSPRKVASTSKVNGDAADQALREISSKGDQPIETKAVSIDDVIELLAQQR
jgi:hypothetical protein